MGLIQGRRDIPLNDQGRVQAADAAAKLAGLEYAAVVASPLVRASETARIIADELLIDAVELDEDLMEQAWGAAEGVEWSDLDDAFPDGQIKGRERTGQLVERAERAMDRIARAYAGRNIIVVTHGGLINAVNHRAAAADLSDVRGSAGNGSISDVDVHPDSSGGAPSITYATVSVVESALG
ncbi:hypothetical protein GCM10022202_01530 [Microbacterium marinilacus]|uniref:Histidine phosphatase family protein n=2 Tax=Microbacterium marinilacus TaxID=415209 RepID=A0ABP7B2Z9_9MICO